jgi:hypothetical protein
MKPIVEILQRADYFKKRISLLDNLRSREMEKPIIERNNDLLLFLGKEQNKYTCSLREFQWLLGIEDKTNK